MGDPLLPPADGFDAGAGALRHRKAELATEAAQGIDAGRAGAHPQRAGTVQTLQGLLLDRLHLDRNNVGGTCRFQKRAGIGGIGLVALYVGPDVSGRQELDRNAEPIQRARPMMGRASGFHNDQTHFAIGEPAFELGTRQAVRFDDLPGRIGNGQLEDTFCKIHGNSSSMHFGFLLGVVRC